MGQLYEIMLVKSKADAKKEVDEALLAARDVNNQTSKGAKRADNVIIKEVFDGARNRFEKVNEMLTPLGVDEISFPKAFGRLHYDNFYKEHPEFMKKKEPQQQTQAQQQQPAKTPTKSGNEVAAANPKNTKAADAFVKALASKKNCTHWPDKQPASKPPALFCAGGFIKWILLKNKNYTAGIIVTGAADFIGFG